MFLSLYCIATTPRAVCKRQSHRNRHYTSDSANANAAPSLSLPSLSISLSLSFLPLSSPSLSLFPFSDFIMARNSSREIMGPARSEFCHYVVVLRHAAPWIGVMGQMAGGSSGDGGGDGAVSILIYLGALGLAMAERGVILRK